MFERQSQGSMCRDGVGSKSLVKWKMMSQGELIGSLFSSVPNSLITSTFQSPQIIIF